MQSSQVKHILQGFKLSEESSVALICCIPNVAHKHKFETLTAAFSELIQKG